MTRQNYRFAILAALLCVALASCSKDNTLPPGSADGSDVPISLIAEIGSASSGGSKAPIVDGVYKAMLGGVHFLRKDSVAPPVTYAGQSPLVGTRTLSGTINFSPTVPVYAKSGVGAYLTAYWPGTGAALSGDKASWTIDGKTDILVAPTWYAGAYLQPKTTGMVFEHQLAQLEVVCKATSAADVTVDNIRTTWGDIMGIEIVNNLSTATFDYATQRVQFENQSNIALLNPDYETAFASMAIPDNTNTAVTAAGMFAPQQGSIIVRVTTATMGAVTLEVQLRKDGANIDFERGKRHRVTIEFEKSQLLIATYTEIADWSTAYDGEIDLPAQRAPQVEDYYYTDGTFSRNLAAGKTVEGVVFWVDPTNPWHIKIVAMDEPPANWDGGTNTAGCLPWSTEQVTTNATSASDGKQNTLMLMMRDNAPTAYPAAKWCYTRNTGLSIPAASSAATSDANYKWYLPAKDELQHIFCAYRGAAPTTWADDASGAPAAAAGYPAAWNARFTGKTVFASPYYWSSTEGSSTGSWHVYFTSGDTYYYNLRKTDTGIRARCVREIIY